MILPNKNNLPLVGSLYVTEPVLETNPFVQQIFIEFQVPFKVLWIKPADSQSSLNLHSRINEINQQNI